MPPVDPAILDRVRAAYEAANARISAAAQKSGRRGDDIALVAVTKYCAMDEVRALLSLGHLDLGESRAQQLEERAALLAGQTTEPIRWHMIGHLQRNKIKQVAHLAALIHSVDSLRLAEELHAHGARHDMVLDVLVQVNASGEDTKTGVPPAAAIHLCEQVESMAHLRLRGLMTMAAPAQTPEDLETKVRPSFSRVRGVFNDIRRADFCNKDFNVLSMGMSGDFEVAIEEGSNVVRLGSVLFGE
jgi:pyridoxal phosphate enzyme (YggS family)